jgi:raffinose/stachyose/melibiose transport system permease protein
MRKKPSDFWHLLSLGLAFLAGDVVATAYILTSGVPFETIFRAIIYFPAIASPIVVGIVWLIFRSFFESLPLEVEEAAKMDGCSKLGIYWRIVMPISWPAIAVVIIFQFMASFNEFVLALVTIDRNDLKPLTLVPSMYSGQFMARPGVMFAILALITIPVLVIYILMQRYLTRGMTAGAVKG